MNLIFQYVRITIVNNELPEYGRKGDGLKSVIVIGGGASGMTAAISAARQGARVTIIDHMDRIGKKILSTGNGKCNYTNQKQGVRYYRGENPAFVLPVFSQFGLKETLSFFRELGIYPKERDGYFYPASGQAASVLEVLRMELKRLSVEIRTKCHLTSVQKTKKGFLLSTTSGNLNADSCIFACGGKSFPKSGSDGSAFPYIEQLGHTFIDVVPALVQMKAKQSFFKSIAGIRADILITLYTKNDCIKERGEVQLTNDGISGIPSFQVSRFAAKALRRKERVFAVLDFMPDLSKEELQQELIRRFFRDDGKTCEEVLIGLFSKKLIPVFLKENQISLHKIAKQVDVMKLEKFASYLKNVKIDILNTKGFESSQVTAGGVSTAELQADTLESKIVPGLFFAGEVIDIDGMCGGYNLQWAWSSGYVAGMNAARR